MRLSMVLCSSSSLGCVCSVLEVQVGLNSFMVRRRAGRDTQHSIKYLCRLFQSTVSKWFPSPAHTAWVQ